MAMQSMSQQLMTDTDSYLLPIQFTHEWSAFDWVSHSVSEWLVLTLTGSGSDSFTLTSVTWLLYSDFTFV